MGRYCLRRKKRGPKDPPKRGRKEKEGKRKEIDKQMYGQCKGYVSLALTMCLRVPKPQSINIQLILKFMYKK
jgi:hypothetical protein